MVKQARPKKREIREKEAYDPLSHLDRRITPPKQILRSRNASDNVRVFEPPKGKVPTHKLILNPFNQPPVPLEPKLIRYNARTGRPTGSLYEDRRAGTYNYTRRRTAKRRAGK